MDDRPYEAAMKWGLESVRSGSSLGRLPGARSVKDTAREPARAKLNAASLYPNALRYNLSPPHSPKTSEDFGLEAARIA